MAQLFYFFHGGFTPTNGIHHFFPQKKQKCRLFTSLHFNNNISNTIIPFRRETKQEDVISLILFLLFISPLLFAIKNECKGYSNPQTGMTSHGSAIVNDILILFDNKNDLQSAFKIVCDFSEATGILINPKKSAYVWCWGS